MSLFVFFIKNYQNVFKSRQAVVSFRCLITVMERISPSHVGTKVMPFLCFQSLVIKMECTQKQQSLVCAEISPLIGIRTTDASKQIDTCDKGSAELLKYLAFNEAIHQLERSKALGMALAYRSSIIR